MRRTFSLFACATAVVAMTACRGSNASPVPFADVPHAASRALGPLASATFVPIGPTHMSDGLPSSGKVNAFAIDPRHAKTIYVASGRGTGLETYSSAGIYRTTDGGENWQPIDRGLTDLSGMISSTLNALWLDPAAPSTLLAASEYDGIFRSTDGGSSWANVYRTSHATQFAFFAGAVYAATAAGILASSDGGATWTVSLAGTPARAPTAFAAATGASGNAFFAGMTDGTIYAFSNGAWIRKSKLPYNPHTGTDGSTPAVHQLAVDPLRPSLLYASSNDGSWDQNLFASTDGGGTWKYVLKPRYAYLGLGTQAIAFSVAHPHVLYLGVDGGLYVFAADGSASPHVRAAANLSVIDVRNVWTFPNESDDACWIASDQGLDYEPACSRHTAQAAGYVATASVATGLARRFTVSPNGLSLQVSLQDFNSHWTADGGQTWHVTNRLYEDGFNELR
ncbi:MAG: hypothetical protein JO199_09780, partial [Candidatus Eremiobacteraeota bacterium]|nr:hypothetical protein [Candidatus Eremiobacteraeota bacterium]